MFKKTINIKKEEKRIFIKILEISYVEFVIVNLSSLLAPASVHVAKVSLCDVIGKKEIASSRGKIAV